MKKIIILSLFLLTYSCLYAQLYQIEIFINGTSAPKPLDIVTEMEQPYDDFFFKATHSQTFEDIDYIYSTVVTAWSISTIGGVTRLIVNMQELAEACGEIRSSTKVTFDVEILTGTYIGYKGTVIVTGGLNQEILGLEKGLNLVSPPKAVLTIAGTATTPFCFGDPIDKILTASFDETAAERPSGNLTWKIATKAAPDVSLPLDTYLTLGGTDNIKATFKKTAPAGEYVVTASVGNVTSEQAVDVTIKSKPAAPTIDDAPTINAVCHGIPFTMTASTIADATYTWDGNQGISTTNNPATFSNVAAGNQTYKVKVSVGGCESDWSGTETVKVKQVKVTTIAKSVAYGGSVKLDCNPSATPTLTSDAEYSWTGQIASGEKTKTPITLALTEPETYTVIVTDEGCESEPATLQVTVGGTPSITLKNIEFCEGEQAGAAKVTKITATLKNITSGEITWNVSHGGTPVLSGANNRTADFSTLPANTYTVIASYAGIPSNEVTVTINGTPAQPTIEVGGSGIEACFVANEKLNTVLTGASGDTYTSYEWYKGESKINNITTENCLVDKNSYHVIAITEANGIKCKSAKSEAVEVIRNQITLTGNPTADPTNVKAQGVSNLTYTGGITVKGNSTEIDRYNWSAGSWTPTGYPTDGAVETDPLGTTTAFKLTVTDNMGCTSSNEKQVTVSVDKKLKVLTITGESDCFGKEIKLACTTEGGYGTKTYLWEEESAADIFKTANAQAGVIKDDAVAGNYRVRVKVTDGRTPAAEAPSEWKDITVIEKPLQPAITVDGGNTDPICFEDDVLLSSVLTETSGNTYASYEWYKGTAKINDIDTEKSIVGETKYQVVGVTETNGKKCYSEKSPEVTVQRHQVTLGGTPTATPDEIPDQTTTTLTYTAAITHAVSTGASIASYNWSNSVDGWNKSSSETNGSQVTDALGANRTFALTVTDNRGCTSAEKLVSVVVNGPLAVTPVGGEACFGHPINLEDGASGGSQTYTDWEWTASDPAVVFSSTTAENPQILETTPVGDYTVQVKVTDDAGDFKMSDPVAIEVLAAPTRPTITAIPSACFTEDEAFDLESDDVTNTHAWYEGSSSEPLEPSTYKYKAGATEYSLEVEHTNGCFSGKSEPATVTRHQITLTGTPTADSPIAFKGSSELNYPAASITHAVAGSTVAEYTWSVDDEVKGTGNPFTATDLRANTTFKLVVTDNNGCTSNEKTVLVEVDGPLTANPTATETKVCFGSTIQLTANPSGGSKTFTGFKWEGEGVTFVNPNIENAIIAGSTPVGSYTVTVTVTDSKNAEETSGTLEIEILGPPAKPSIVGVTEECFTEKQLFNLSTAESAASYEWYEGTTKITDPATHIYKVGKTKYSVIAVNEAGCKSLKSDAVEVVRNRVTIKGNLKATPPTIAYQTKSELSCPTTSIGYEGNSNSIDLLYAWSDGYGWTGAGSPVTTASLEADRTFTLKVTDSKGCVSNEKTVKVIVNGPLKVSPKADPACFGKEIQLTSNPSGGSKIYPKYEWSCEDANIEFVNANIRDAKIKAGAPDGTYIVTVKVEDSSGATATAEIEVVIMVPPVKPTITAPIADACFTENEIFDLTADAAASYEWYEGATKITDPSTYAYKPGSFEYAVIAINEAGCKSDKSDATEVVRNRVQLTGTPTATTPIDHLTTSELTYSGGFDYNGNSSTVVEYTWTNDFTSWTSTGSPVITEALEADRTFTLTVTDDMGCTSNTKEVKVVVNGPLSVSPEAGVGCFGEQIQLTANPSGGSREYTSFKWEGAGVTFVNANFEDAIVAPITPADTYNVTVTVTDSDGNTTNSSIELVVGAPPTQPTIYNFADECFTEGQKFVLETDPAASYEWYEGATKINPSTYIHKPGTFEYTVIAINEAGCKSEKSDPVTMKRKKIEITTTSLISIEKGETADLDCSPIATPALTDDVVYSWTPTEKIDGSVNKKSVTTLVLNESQTFKVTVGDEDCHATDSIVVSLGEDPDAGNPPTTPTLTIALEDPRDKQSLKLVIGDLDPTATGYIIYSIENDAYNIGGTGYKEFATVTDGVLEKPLYEADLKELVFFYVKAYKGDGEARKYSTETSDTVGYYKYECAGNNDVSLGNQDYVSLYFDIAAMGIIDMEDLMNYIGDENISAINKHNYGTQLYETASFVFGELEGGDIQLSQNDVVLLSVSKEMSFLQYGKLPSAVDVEIHNTNEVSLGNQNWKFLQPSRMDIKTFGELFTEIADLSAVNKWNYSTQLFESASYVFGELEGEIIPVAPLGFIQMVLTSGEPNYIWKSYKE